MAVAPKLSNVRELDAITKELNGPNRQIPLAAKNFRIG
jgi:hypothetical protein